jgi:hypothetical protein
MAMELDLIPPGTTVEENGEGQMFDVSSSATRTFYCVLLITQQVEQESLDVAIWGSADAENWGTQPILKLPQQFYRGETRAVLELSYWPDVKFIRARWELNRWGRGTPLPIFQMGLHLTEMPAIPVRPGVVNPVSSAV